MSSPKPKRWLWILIGCSGLFILLCIGLVAVAQVLFVLYQQPIIGRGSSSGRVFSFAPGQPVCQTPYQPPSATLSPANAAQIEPICDIVGVEFVGWVSNGKELAVTDGRNLHFIDTAKAVLNRSVPRSGGLAICQYGKFVAVSPDGRFAGLSCWVNPNEILKVLNLESESELAWNMRLEQHLRDARFAPDGKSLALELNNGIVMIDVLSGERIPIRPTLGEGSKFSPDLRFVAVRNTTETEVWDLKGNKLLSVPVTGRGIAGEFSPDGRLILVPPGKGEVEVWDLSKGQMLGVLNISSYPYHFSPLGDLVVFQAGRQSFTLLQVDNNKFLASPKTGVRINLLRPGLTFSPDGRLLAINLEETTSDGHRLSIAVQLWGIVQR